MSNWISGFYHKSDMIWNLPFVCSGFDIPLDAFSLHHPFFQPHLREFEFSNWYFLFLTIFYKSNTTREEVNGTADVADLVPELTKALSSKLSVPANIFSVSKAEKYRWAQLQSDCGQMENKLRFLAWPLFLTKEIQLTLKCPLLLHLTGRMLSVQIWPLPITPFPIFIRSSPTSTPTPLCSGSRVSATSWSRSSTTGISISLSGMKDR